MFCCCVPCPRTSASASDRSSASSRSAWNTSRPRSKRAGTASRSPTCASSARSTLSCGDRVRIWSASPPCTRSRPTKSLALARRVRARRAGRADRRRRAHGGRVSGAVSRARGDRGRARRWRAGDAGALRRDRARAAARQRAWAGTARRRRRHGADRRAKPARSTLDDVPLPARHHVEPWRRAVRVPGASARLADRDGARLSVPLLVLLDLAAARAHRSRAIDRLRLPRLRIGRRSRVRRRRSLLAPPSRSLELARELRRRGIRKKWILVQSRADLVARHPELLEAWRPHRRGLRHLLRPGSGDRRRPRRASQGRDRGRDAHGRRTSRVPTATA